MKPRKIAFISIGVLMLGVFLVIVFGDNGLIELRRLKAARQTLLKTNADLARQNRELYRTIDRLQNDPVFVEYVARRELGMIRSDELIFKFNTETKDK